MLAPSSSIMLSVPTDFVSLLLSVIVINFIAFEVCEKIEESSSLLTNALPYSFPLLSFFLPSFSRFLCSVLTLVAVQHVTVGGTLLFFVSGGVEKKSEFVPSELLLGDRKTLFCMTLEDADFRKYSSVLFFVEFSLLVVSPSCPDVPNLLS